MFTQCPQCLTIYCVDGATLGAACGSVRCGGCETIFDAFATLVEQLPPEPVERLPVHAVQAEAPHLSVPVTRPEPAQTPIVETVETPFVEPVQAPFVEPPAPPRATRTPPPTFARRRGPRKPRNNGAWLAACCVLMLTLGTQIAWSQRAEWLDDARVRNVLDPLCARLSCRLPLRHDGSALELLSRDIQPHPSVPGALIISATLRNDASFAQAYPTVEVSLSNLDDKTIAMRRFQPRDYVADARAIRQGIAAGASASLVFEVADPGKNAVAFEFKFE